jgi:hypothetical protein
MITTGKGLKMGYGLGILREVGVGEGKVVVECGCGLKHTRIRWRERKRSALMLHSRTRIDSC